MSIKAVALIVTLIMGVVAAMASTGSIVTYDTILGSHFRAVEQAVKVFTSRNLDLNFYKITVVREGSSLVVIFTDKDAAMGGRGSPGTRPGFEVELDEKDLRVLRANFIR
jgi:hypothetical protein